MDVTDNGVPVTDLITVIKEAIKQANVSKIDSNRDLQVVSVQLTLNAVAAATIGGGLDFRIPFLGMKLRLGHTVTQRDTHTLDITLVPSELSPSHEIRSWNVETALVDAIKTIREVVVHASGGEDPFLLQESVVQLTFAVAKDGSISLGVDGELKDEVTHTLRLGLAPPHTQTMHQHANQ